MERYGAFIERGIVMRHTEDGYIVQSADRDGITTPPITYIGDEEITVGDEVCFFLFSDGTGRIICLY